MAKVLVVVNDLFFADRLANGLVGTGHAGQVVDLSMDPIPTISPETELVIVDLEAGDSAFQVIQLARAVQTPVLAFGPHTDTALRQRALDAGADRVVAKSKLTTNFGELIAAMTGR